MYKQLHRLIEEFCGGTAEILVGGDTSLMGGDNTFLGHLLTIIIYLGLFIEKCGEKSKIAAQSAENSAILSKIE